MQGKVAVPGRIAGSAERRGSITPRIDEAPQGKSEDGHHLPPFGQGSLATQDPTRTLPARFGSRLTC